MAEELNKNNIESSVDNVDKLYSTQEKPGDYYPIAPTAYDASALSIKDNIVGDPSSPNPYPSQIPPPNAKDVDWLTQTDILRSYVEGSTIAAQNPNQYARLYEFNSGPNNPNTFFERYSTRGTSAFKEIDFHPIHNNEEALNSATNFLGDLKHTIGNSFFPIFIKGIQAGYQSLPRMFITGDFFGEDKQFSRDYAYYNNLSYSSKDNLGSFVNNLTMNFAYTAGLLATAVFENWAGSAFSLGSAYRGLGSFTPYGQAIRNVKIGENIAGAAVDGGKVTNESMRHLNNLGNARKFWNWITGERTFAQFVTENPLAQAINPFSNLTRNYYARIGAIDDIAGMARTSSNFAKTAGAFWRDIRNVNLAVAEGRLESGMVYNTIVDKLYKEHYERTGAPPSVDLMKEFVNEAAKKAQYETAVMNVGLIYFTNKLAFDNLLNPRKNIFKENVKTVGKIGEAGKGEFKITLEQGQFKLNKPGFRTWLRGWKKDPISKSLKNTASYFKVNLLEGVQETSQEIISEATKNYYLDAYNDKTVRKSLFSKAAFGQGSTPLSYYGKAFEKFNPTTKEGFPIFASGFFMGFLSGGLANSVTTLQRQSYKIYDRSGYDAYIAKKEELGNELVDRLNSFGVDEFLNNRYFNAGVQARTATIQNEEDDKHIQDSETEALVSHMTYLMEQGVFEQYINSFEEFSEMTAKEFEEAFPKVPQGEGAEYQAKIPSVIEKAKRIQKEYEKVKKEYPNPINLDDYPTWREDHTEAVILHRAWNQALKQKIFYNESWVSVSKRLNSIKDTLLKEAPSQSLSKRDLDLILDIETKTGLKFEIATLKTEIESLTKNATPESKQLAKEKKKQLDTYQNYLDAYGEFRKQFKRDEYVDAARQVILNARSEEDKDAPITDEEIEKVITKEFGKVTEKTQEKSIENLKKAYAKLVKSAAEKNESIFDNDIDESFSLVLDYYKLSDEKLGLANIINLLNNPNSFTELVGRNQDWMTDMWLNRQGYFNDIVKKEFQEIEDNGVLNALANEGVFISQADFIAWRDHDIMPEEFYDEKNEMVIPQESITYNKYMSLLETHKMLSNIQATISTAGLEQRIRNLNARRNEHLDKIENRLKEEIKIETGKTLEEVRQESEESSLTALNAELENLEKIKKNLKNSTTPENVAGNIKTVREQEGEEIFDDLVEANLINSEKQKEIKKLGKQATKDATLPTDKAEKDLVIKNTGALILTANEVLEDAINIVKEDIENAPETTLLEETKAYKFYTKSKDEVNKRYDNLIEQVKSKIESYEADKVETVTGEKVDIDYVEWAQLPEDLKPILFEAYDKYLESQDFDVAALKKDDRSKYLTLSNKWLKSDEAVAIIEKYNADIEAAKPKSVEELETPDLKTLQGKLEGKTIKQVKGLIQNREKALSESKDAKEREDLESDIATLNKYLDDLRALKKPQSPAGRNYGLFEAMVLGKQNQVNRVKDENDQTIGYEFTSPAKKADIERRRREELDRRRVPMESVYSELEDAGVTETQFYSKINEELKSAEDFAKALKEKGKSNEEIATRVRSRLFKQGNYTQVTSTLFVDTIDELLDNGNFNLTELGKSSEEINAKYDAELAAVEEVTTTTQVSNPIRVTQYAEQLKNQKYKLDPFEYNPVKEENIDRKGKKYRGGLLVEFDAINDMNLSTKQKIDNIITAIKVDKKYGPLQSDAKLESIRAALTNDFSLDNFKRIVNEVAFRESRIAGNTVDELARIALTIDESDDFMKPSKPANMSEKAFEKLMGSKGIITKLQDWARDGKYYFYTGDALLFNKGLFDGRGIVGATDIIAFSGKTGEFVIIDLKTSNKDIQSWDESKMYQYRAQQSIYRNLFYNMTGIMPSDISLLPMEVDVDIQNEGYINDIILEKLDGTKPVKNSSAVGIEYLSDVEAGVPLIAPTDIPVELQGEVEDTGEVFNPFAVPEELKEQFVEEENIKSVEEIANKIRNAKTLDEANTARTQAYMLQLAEPAVAQAISKMLDKEFNAKIDALNKNVDAKDLGKGMILVSENPIFEDASNYVEVYRVYEKNGEPFITVRSIGLKGKAKQKSMSVSEANSMFTKSTAEEAKAATTASQEAKDASAQSKQNQKEFNKNNEVPKSSEKTGMSPLDKIKKFTQNNKKDC